MVDKAKAISIRPAFIIRSEVLLVMSTSGTIYKACDLVVPKIEVRQMAMGKVRDKLINSMIKKAVKTFIHLCCNILEMSRLVLHIPHNEVVPKIEVRQLNESYLNKRYNEDCIL